MKRWYAGIVLAALAALLALGTTGCCAFLESVTNTTGEGSSSSSAGGAPSLEEFLDADSKTGQYRTHTEYDDGTTWDITGTFWVDGRLFRYDIYDNGELIRSIMSPDGETAYFVEHNGEYCEPSVASVDYYLAMYSEPDASATDDGIDEETGATRVVYTIQRTENMAGASNPWYTEDITYLVKDDGIIGCITRGCVPEDDGSIGTFNVSRQLFADVQVGVSIPADTFVLPYPMKEAQ